MKEPLDRALWQRSSLAAVVRIGGLLPLVLLSSAVATIPRPQEPQFLPVDFVIEEWDASEETADELTFLAGPAGIAFDDQDNIYVLDSQNQRIAVFSPAGKLLRAFGRGGQGPGEFQFSRRGYLQADLSVLSDRIFVLDAPQRRVHVFDLTGAFLDSLALSGSPRSLAARESQVAIWDGGIGLNENLAEVLILNLDGEVLRRVGEPLFPVTDTFRRRYNGNHIELGPDGIVARAYERWPLIRFSFPQREVVEVRLEGPLWSDDELGTKANDALRAYELAVDNDRFDSPKTLFLKDIEYSPSARSWFVLGARDTVFRLDESFNVTRTLMLEQHGASNERTYSLSDIAISSAADILCGASGAGSLVVCYDLRFE